MSPRLIRSGALLCIVLSGTLLLSSCAPASVQSSNLSAIQLASPTASSPSNLTEETEAKAEVSDSFAELEIEDQSGSGLFIEVEEVRLSLGTSFLVVSDKDGSILGYAIATPDSQPVSVPLATRLSSSQKLIAQLFLDNGDGEFSIETDAKLIDDEGDLVEEDFDYAYRPN